MKFVANSPAMQLGETLIVADLHLGIEFEYRKKSVAVAMQHLSAAAELNQLKQRTDTKHLVVLGDLKHDVAGIGPQVEREMLDEFFCALQYKQVIVCKGNHDSGIERLASDSVKIIGSEGFVLDAEGRSFGLCHGHAWPGESLFSANTLVMAHNHPRIEMVDSLGSRAATPSWIVGTIHESEDMQIQFRGVKEGQPCVIIPAFGKLCAGTSVNRVTPSQMLGPLFQNNLFDLENAKAYSLQGVDLGKIGTLRSQAKF